MNLEDIVAELGAVPTGTFFLMGYWYPPDACPYGITLIKTGDNRWRQVGTARSYTNGDLGYTVRNISNNGTSSAWHLH